MQDDILTIIFARYRLGDFSSVVGLFISVVGFAVTLIGIKKTKSAALAAEISAMQAKEGLSILNVLSDVSSAIAVIDEIRRLQKAGAWTIILDRYSSLKRSLVAILHLHPSLSDEEKNVMDIFIKSLTSMEVSVEKALEAGKAPNHISKWNRNLSEQADKLHKILVQLKASAE